MAKQGAVKVREKGGEVKILIKTLDQSGFDDWEKRMPQVKDTTVIVFSSLRLAIHMGSCFVHKDLIPRVGKEKASKFPLVKTGPGEDGCEAMSEALGLKKPSPEKETWFLVSNSRFPEFYDYLTKKYPAMNPEVEIQDLRNEPK